MSDGDPIRESHRLIAYLKEVDGEAGKRAEPVIRRLASLITDLAAATEYQGAMLSANRNLMAQIKGELVPVRALASSAADQIHSHRDALPPGISIMCMNALDDVLSHCNKALAMLDELEGAMSHEFEGAEA